MMDARRSIGPWIVRHRLWSSGKQTAPSNPVLSIILALHGVACPRRLCYLIDYSTSWYDAGVDHSKQSALAFPRFVLTLSSCSTSIYPYPCCYVD